ncbi:hypothetical protein TARUN_954, partial [Trichoderma arundinaceum]
KYKDTVRGIQSHLDKLEIAAVETTKPTGAIKENSRLIVKGTIRGHAVSILIDSGSDSNLINHDLVNRLRLPWHKKPREKVYEVGTVEDQLYSYNRGLIDMETDHLEVKFQDRTESLQLDLMRIKHDVILAYIRRELVALDKALQEAKIKEEDTPEEERLKRIPRQYRKYKKLYNKVLEEGLPPHTEWDHEIVLKDGASPKFHKIYNLSETELKTLREWIKEQLQKGYIRVSKSPAGYPIIFVPKKDGKLRLVIDYRQLNDITIKDRTPLPLITEIRERLQGMNWFTALDLKGAYELTRMKKGHEWMTAFRTRYGLYEYLVMPQGLTNAPASFQKRINHVLKEYLDEFVIAYIDDILIFSKTLEEHEEHVHKVLQKLQDAKLLVNPEKCAFHTQRVEFLGHIISPGEIRMDPKKLEAVKTWEPPKNVKDVQSFLGFANYYRRFIRNFAQIAAPLSDLTKKDRKFLWGPDVNQAFERLKNALISEPVLVMFDPTKEIEIETDASDFAIGGVIGQRNEEGKLRPIAFFSKKLHGPELRYATYDKEFMAIVAAFKEWRHYCHGSMYKIKVFTDHRNITYFATTQVLSKRQTGYFEFLSQFDYQIIHCKGTENGRADALSRKAELFQETPEVIAQVIHLNEQGHYEQKTIATIFRFEEYNPVDEEIKEYVKNWNQDQFPEESSLHNGLPMINDKIWVPEELRRKVVRAVHVHPLHGHKGIRKTKEQVQRYYTFDGIKKQVQHVVSHCDLCQRAKAGRHKPYGLLQPLPVPERPWESISFDHITKLPPSKEPVTGITYDSIFVVVDRLTKMSYFIPYKEASTAEELAYVFARFVTANHGLPGEMISDRGSTFVSKFWKALNNRLGTHHKASTAHHPQTDGQTERINQIVKDYLVHYINLGMEDWVEKLPIAQFAYNSTQSESTGKSPFFLNFGFEPEAYRLPREGEDVEKAIIQADDLKKLHDELQIQLEFIRVRMKEYADRNRIEGPILKEGDMVYVLTHPPSSQQQGIGATIKTKRPSEKLDFKKVGPYKVLRKAGEVSYEIDIPLPPNKKGKPIFRTKHISQLEKALVDEETGEIIHDEIVIEGEELEYEVESILAIKLDPETRTPRYLIKWKGYS